MRPHANCEDREGKGSGKVSASGRSPRPSAGKKRVLGRTDFEAVLDRLVHQSDDVFATRERKVAEGRRGVAGGLEDLPLVPAREDEVAATEGELVALRAHEVVSKAGGARDLIVQREVWVEGVVHTPVNLRAEVVRIVVEERASVGRDGGAERREADEQTRESDRARHHLRAGERASTASGARRRVTFDSARDERHERRGRARVAPAPSLGNPEPKITRRHANETRPRRTRLVFLSEPLPC